MRLALQTVLTNPSAVFILRNAVLSDGASFCQHYSTSAPTLGQSREYATKEQGREKSPEPEAELFQIRKFPALMVPVTHHDLHSGNLSSRIQFGLPTRAKGNKEGWRHRLATFEQYQYESDLEAPASQGRRLVDDPLHTRNWDLWLELIIFRKRHHGAEGTIAIYKEILRRGLRLPTLGIIANQLWDLLIRAGFYDSRLLQEIVTYAIHLKRSTRRSWPEVYYGIVSVALKRDPQTAYSWHMKLRNDFPPSLENYKKMFKQSLDRDSWRQFRGLYTETPLVGMYRTVIWHLCKLQMYDEALKWHYLLCNARDFPARLTDIKPLLDHLAYIGDAIRLEKIVRALSKAKVGVSIVAENFVRKDAAISREIMNRQLGEVHGVGPKHLTDSFCARLFATRLFSVDTIISGLQMMAAEAIGPLALREIAVRDDCDPRTICHHTDGLKNAGISLDDSVFCTLVRSLAIENKRGILKSIVDCDLHPDTFTDFNLQERLLAQYYEENDLMKIERTLAILTNGCAVKDLQMVRMNLILRCQVTLGRAEKVLVTLGQLKQMGISVSARSSRHLRVRWLSRRQVGRAAGKTHELGILIQASRMSMQSGRFVPIIAWREILRRLGMAGRLTEFENLALWLVDWYSSSTAKAALQKRLLLSSHGGQALIEGHVSPGKFPSGEPQPFLHILFTRAAQHAIVAWGFQHFAKSSRSIRRLNKASMIEDPHRFQWIWGLRLLYKLRERGVPIKKSYVARICRIRLNILFGAGLSKRKINRRARSEILESYTETVYIRKMKAIWGEGLFRLCSRNVERIGGKPQKSWRPRRIE